jgi:D-alanine-D-alanine ligase
MKVAIVCNVKPNEVSELEVEEEPPSLGSFNLEDFAEWDSAKTIKAVFSALKKEYDVKIILAQSNFYNQLMNNNIDFVFNMAEGLKGSFRESIVPALLEEYNIPYTGSDPLTLSICLDKGRTKEILSFYKIPTPKFLIFSSEEEIKRKKIKFLPVIVKPVREGSSKGIYNDNLCFEEKKAKEKAIEILNKLKQPVLVEKYLSGREFTVAVLGNFPNLQILPIVEIKFGCLPEGANPIYSYEAKWVWDRPENPLPLFNSPAEIEKKLEKKIIKIVKKTIKVFRVRDWCRVDIRLDEEGSPNILELNPLPGIIPGDEENSCFPKAAKAAGISYEDLILKVMKIARERYEKDFNNLR